MRVVSPCSSHYLIDETKGYYPAMWKPNQPGNNLPSSPEPVRPAAPSGTTFEPAAARPTAGAAGASSAVPTGEQATIGKSLIVKGELSGSESLYIDGKVEGAINLPGNRVTVGRNGQVAANIVAREVVVLVVGLRVAPARFLQAPEVEPDLGGRGLDLVEELVDRLVARRGDADPLAVAEQPRDQPA